MRVCNSRCISISHSFIYSTMNIKQTITHNLLNVPGWRTNRHIVVIESDDWGSIRMPSKEVYDRLLNSGYRVDLCHFSDFDSLETGADLTNLFEVLDSVRDSRNHPAVLTANCVVANPDFDRIKACNFEESMFSLPSMSL